jgi:uncharacterized protein YegP (UPF0339 family)
MTGRFVVKASGDRFIFNLQAGHDEIILTSEPYTAKARALHGIRSLRRNAVRDESYQRLVSSSGQPYFVVRGINDEVLGTSEPYPSSFALEGGIAAVRVNAPEAALEDRAR